MLLPVAVSVVLAYEGLRQRGLVSEPRLLGMCSNFGLWALGIRIDHTEQGLYKLSNAAVGTLTLIFTIEFYG